jgi:hypothetical protein
VAMDEEGSGSFKVKSEQHGERFEGWFKRVGRGRAQAAAGSTEESAWS